mmetsp:Transcript_31123/g.64058  ORF Transcript_31123/g.64058 Transcript_31123/m.64058 type:complete len:99 (+) Transcript_31123:766-1062(+)
MECAAIGPLPIPALMARDAALCLPARRIVAAPQLLVPEEMTIPDPPPTNPSTLSTASTGVNRGMSPATCNPAADTASPATLAAKTLLNPGKYRTAVTI